MGKRKRKQQRIQYWNKIKNKKRKIKDIAKRKLIKDKKKVERGKR